MTDEMYKRLNEYLNIIFLGLSNTSKVFLDKLKEINILNSIIYINFRDLKIENRFIKNNLTYNEVFLLAREILETIDPKYLSEFDLLLNSGKLDFNYENEFDNSNFCLVSNDEVGVIHKLINIHRNFTYDDVVTLIHEFFHYTNANSKQDYFSDNRVFFTEFISIYFELIAQKYLLEKKDVTIDELSPNERIINLLRSNSILYKYIVILLAYEKLGNINKNTEKNLETILDFQDSFFERECIDFLKKLDKIKNNSFEKEINDRIIDEVNFNYKYVVGIFLAYYALENLKIEDMVKLNDKIISPEYSKMSVEEILETIGIKYNFKMVEETIEIIKNKIYVYESDKVI